MEKNKLSALVVIRELGFAYNLLFQALGYCV